MRQVRRLSCFAVRGVFAASLTGALTACVGDVFGWNGLSSLEITPFTVTVLRGDSMRLSAVTRDGDTIANARIEWRSENEQIVTVSPAGVVTGVGTGGPIVITASAGGQSAVAQVSVRPRSAVPVAVAPMFDRLSSMIGTEVMYLESMLPLNPTLQSEIRSKIALLERPTLASEVIDGGFYAQDSVRSRDGRTIPIVSVYARSEFAPDARSATRRLVRSLPVLEQFIGLPFPAAAVHLWQGFTVSSRGGAGEIYMPDVATHLRIQQLRPLPNPLPYDAILAHELSHSYVGNEGLTQFLELYAYNVLETGSSAVAAWKFTRGYQPLLESNTEVHAVLDVYLLIGEQAMGRAFAAVRAIGAKYGVPLSGAVQQAFVDAAPDSVRARVAAKVTRVTF